jgi:hypothetical protein
MGRDETGDLEIIVIGDLSIGIGHGSSSDYPDHPTLAEKEMYKGLSEILGVGSIVFGAAGSAMPFLGPEAVGPALVAILAAAAMGIGAIGLAHLADDPPQSDYQRPVRVNRLAIYPSGEAGTELPGAQPLLNTFNDLIPVERGMLDAYERAQGARAAGNRKWALAHGHGARLLLGCASARLLQLAGRIEQFRSEHFDALDLSSSEYISLQEQARTHNVLPERAKAILLNGGLTREDLLAFEDSIARRAIDTLPTGKVKSLISDLVPRLRTVATTLILA